MRGPQLDRVTVMSEPTTEIEQFRCEPLDASISTVSLDGEAWFVAADVCRVLGLGNPSMALRRLPDQEKSKTLIRIEGSRGNPNKYVVNESGLYSLILRSDKAEARLFQKWVTGTVLPELRKKGFYVTDDATEEQLVEAKAEVEVRLIRLQERMDYKNVLGRIKKAGAKDGRDYADVQNYLYYRAIGMTARTVKERQPQIDQTKGRVYAKDCLTDPQLKAVNAVTLGVVAHLDLFYPDGRAPMGAIYQAIDHVTAGVPRV